MLAAVQPDLAVVRDVHGGARDRLADRAVPGALGRVGGRRGGGLGEAVALEDLDARAREEQPEPPVHRRAAGHGVPHPAAHRLADLGVDELVEELVLHPQRRPTGPGPMPKALRLHAPPRTARRPRRPCRTGPPCPPRSALRRAALKTFSKMYGTARMNVGRNAARSGSSAAALELRLVAELDPAADRRDLAPSARRRARAAGTAGWPPRRPAWSGRPAPSAR